MPKELETLYMTDNCTTVADFIRSRPAASDNVLLDDAGNLRFIDPPIRLKKPARAVINELIGESVVLRSF